MNLSLEAMKRDTGGVQVFCASSPSSGLWAIVLSAPQTDFHFQTDKSLKSPTAVLTRPPYGAVAGATGR